MARIALRMAAWALALAAQACVHAADGPSSTAPATTLTTLDGKVFDLSAQRGRWVVINFWATWCTPCIKELPELDAFARAHAEARVLGLAWEDIERSDLDAFLAQHPVTYPIAVADLDNPPFGLAAPRGLPMTLVIAPDGQKRRVFTGPVDAAQLETVLRDAGPGKAAVAD